MEVTETEKEKYSLKKEELVNNYIL